MKKIQYFRLACQIFYFSVLIFSLTWLKLPYERQLIIGGTLLLGSIYCGWMCGFGTLQEWLGKLGSKIGKRKILLPPKLDRLLSLLRYSGPILGLTLIVSALDARKGFFAYVRGENLTEITFYAVIIFSLLSLFIDRPFCRWFCLQGAMYGVTSFFRIFTIKRNPKTCVQCKQCDRSCPMGIEISTCDDVLNPQCIDCFRCISNCPKGSETLPIGLRNFKTRRSFLLLLIPVGVLLLFFVMVKLGLRSGLMH